MKPELVKVIIRFVDGSLCDYEEGDSILSVIDRMKQGGYTGKQIIHEIYTDDFGCPPRSLEVVSLSGEIIIPYE